MQFAAGAIIVSTGKQARLTRAYAEGGVEYYESVLRGNKALRMLLGTFGRSATIHDVRQRNVDDKKSARAVNGTT
jgi:hypothetical protein